MRTLLVGYRAADLTPQLLEGDVTCHVLDVYHRHAIEKVHHAKVICAPHLPEGPWDVIRFKTGPKIHSGELALDLLQECTALAHGDRNVAAPAGSSASTELSMGRRHSCRLEIDFDGRERDRNDLLDKIADNPKRVRSFKAEWPASVPGGEKLMFTSYPGCFCHRRLDEGGLALAEVASRELCSRIADFKSQISHFRLLDMGCGCGLVGLLIADRLWHSNNRKTEQFANRTIEQSNSSPVEQSNNSSIEQSNNSSIEQSNNSSIDQSNNRTISLVMVDSHSRAVEAARENAAKFGIPAEVILSDNGTPARMDGTFDVFVGNPPYYSDYRIAEVFLDTAKRALKPGGVCYTVVKNAAGLKPVQERYFPSVEVIPRRNYSVLKSVKV